MFKDINFICQYDQNDYVRNSLKFGVAYAKFLQAKNKEEAFEDIKMQICELAEAGELQAMAMYLTYVTPNNWSATVLNLAKQIYQKDKKTPEEWEVMAALYSHETVQVDCYNHSTKTRDLKEFSVFQLKDKIKSISDLSEILYYNNQGQDSIDYYVDGCSMLHKYKKSNYAKAQERAMMGYYARYFHCGGKVTDASAFYDLSQGVNLKLFDKTKIKSKGLPVWKREDFAKKIESNLKHCKDAVTNQKTPYLYIDLLAVAKILRKSKNLKLQELGAQTVNQIASGNIKPEIKEIHKEKV